MWRFILSVGSALMLVAGPAVAQTQGTKTVTGTIASISPGSVTVKAADGKEMTFKIDAKTQVVAPGGGTKAREAKAEGKGVTASELLKTGEHVEIRYHEDGMHAASIRAVSSVPKGTTGKAHTVSGVVTSVGGDSITVKGSSGEMTLAVDDKTTVSGEGVGTAGKKLTSEGKKTTLSEFVHDGDSVTVTYHDMDGKHHASVIRITKRKK